MTDPDSALDREASEADVLDQRREEGTAPEVEPFDEVPVEANEADVVEQHLVVPEPDD
jgi:hypothetical protein